MILFEDSEGPDLTVMRSICSKTQFLMVGPNWSRETQLINQNKIANNQWSIWLNKKPLVLESEIWLLNLLQMMKY